MSAPWPDDLDAEFPAPKAPPLTEAEVAALNGNAGNAEPFAGLTNEHVLALTFDDERQLVEDLVEAGVVGVVAGVPETHKSWVAQAIAVGVARGEGEVLGCRIVHHGAVGYFWQDDSRRNEAERVQLYSRRHELAAGLPVTWFLNEGLQLPRDLQRLRATVERDELVLVVLDSFYNVATGADLKDRDAGEIFAALKSDVCDETGCTALVAAGRARVSDILKSTDLFSFEAGPNRSRLWVARDAETHPGHLFAPSQGSGGLTGGPSKEGHHRATDAAGGLGGLGHTAEDAR
jgi:hypothetical protein